MNNRTKRKIARQLKGFRPRLGWPEAIRKAFGPKVPGNLEVTTDEDGRIVIRYHIRADSREDAAKALRQMTRAMGYSCSPGDGRPVDESEYRDAPPSGLLATDNPDNLAKWLMPGKEGAVIHRTETGRPRAWKPGPGPLDRPNPFRKQ